MDYTLLGIGPTNYLFIAVFSFLLVFLGIPSIIHVANKLELFDNNESDRKNHRYGISRLGGIAVFCSLFLTTLLFADFTYARTTNYLLTAFILIFAVGLKDDLWGVNPSTKFFIQLLTALTIVLLADIRISNLHGIFSVGVLPYWISVGFSTLLIIFLTNSFNLIDGIDGLVGLTSLIVSAIFGVFFVHMGQQGFACMAFSLMGACFGFLKFNVSPARIFMGDAGSMLIGLAASILAIKFIELNIGPNTREVYFSAAPALTMAALSVPVFDSLRVFILRLIKRKSPFIGDCNHLHHRLIRLGLSHKQASLILLSFEILLFTLVFNFRKAGNEALITFLFVACMIFNLGLTRLINNRERRIKMTVPPGNSRSAVIQQYVDPAQWAVNHSVNTTSTTQRTADNSKMRMETSIQNPYRKVENVQIPKKEMRIN